MNIIDFGFIDKYVVGRSEDQPGWYYSLTPSGLESPDWQPIETFDDSHLMGIAGESAFLIDSSRGKVWVDALLVNSSKTVNSTPFAFYVDPYDGELKVKSWTENYPSGTPTDNSMPRATVCAMWKDFLVLGDVYWKSDESKKLSRKNSSRFTHFLWFSQPGKTDSWDPIDFVAMGQKSGGNVVLGLFPLENGLFVLTTQLCVLLDGTPDDFVYRELRNGISPSTREKSAFWPSKGGVVWADNADRVWFTNGQEFSRIDEPVKIEGIVSVVTVDEYVVVSARSGIHVFRMFEENSGWTRLNVPLVWDKAESDSTKFYGMERKTSGGTFRLDHPENGLLDQNTLWNIVGTTAVFDLYDDLRGVFDGKQVSSVIRSRPLPPSGHEKVFWHRVGVRAKGPGLVAYISSYSGYSEDDDYLSTDLYRTLEDRYDYIVPAHGPSLSAVFEAAFEGDVTVEHMSVWAHKGSTSR